MQKDTDDKNSILVQWQTCVQMADSVSKRRDTTNHLFVTLNLALLAVFPWTFSFKSILIGGAGVILTVLWGFLIYNYKKLNQAKFEVIQDLEKKLPTQPFQKEECKTNDFKFYKDFSKLESALPITFGILYSIVLIFIILSKLCS